MQKLGKRKNLLFYMYLMMHLLQKAAKFCCVVKFCCVIVVGGMRY